MPYLMTRGETISPISDLSDDYWQEEWGSQYQLLQPLFTGRRQDPQYAPGHGDSSIGLDEIPALLPTPYWLCNDGVRELIERFEPGRHAFLPFEIRRKGKLDETITSNLINICEPISTIDIERSGPDIVKVYAKNPHDDGVTRAGINTLNLEVGDGKVFLKKGSFAGRHIWIDAHARRSAHLFISDEMYSDLNKLVEVRYLRFFEVKLA